MKNATSCANNGKALGSAGKGKEWHHIVEQNPTNIARKDIGARLVHTPENVVPLDRELHIKINKLYSSKAARYTSTTTMTVREWLSTQSFEAQREFGLQILKIVLAGGDP